MKLNVYSIFDSKVQAYSQPFFSQTHGAAIRAFTDHVNEDNTPANKHPDDFTLVCLGTFDDQDGTIAGQQLVKLGIAAEYKRPDPQLPLNIQDAIDAKRRAKQ